MPNFDDLINKITAEFHSNPRNKVFAPQELLLESIKEELDKDLSDGELRTIIQNYESGDLDQDGEEIYDAAVFCCSVLSRKCFAEDPEDEEAEVDYQISWIKNDDGSIVAEIRPS